MSTLHALAEAAGLQRCWQDAHSEDQVVSDAALAAILAALGYPAGNDAEARASLARLQQEARRAPAFLSVDAGVSLALPPSLVRAETADLRDEQGTAQELPITDGKLPGISEPGYYTLRIAGHELVLAVAPERCLLPSDLTGSQRKLWGAAIQIPSLHERPTLSGDFGDLRRAVRLLAERGADAVAISPVHAPLPGSDTFRPYSPSSRQFLNPALANVPQARAEGDALIDWSAALPLRAAALDAAFTPQQRRDAEAWAQERGVTLHRHALHDALATHFGNDWRTWPAEYHDPQGAAATRFAEEHPDALARHLHQQWLAEQSLAAVQAEARDAGMAIGLIADLAVGIDPAGSDAWSFRDAMLQGLTIGAPPDPLGPRGQNWGLTSFSPQGLRASAFAPWIAMLRAALRHAGGVRIDHAFGLARLWIVPEGAAASEGAYLSYPLDDLLRLLALESHRAGALIVGEDLGTRPPGFVEPVASRGMLGMCVLWFERDEEGGFIPPEDYPAQAIAMTGTHDTATVAGWWTGRDIDWNRRLQRSDDPQQEEEARMADRTALWSTIGGKAPQPALDTPAPVVEAAIAHLGRSSAALAIVPLEDLLALEEQPNLPGTIDEHPNWRRRLSGPLADLLAEPETARRVAALVAARQDLSAS